MSRSLDHSETGQRQLDSRQFAGASPRPVRSGFTLVELMIVVGIISLLAALAIPNFARNRRATNVRVCINNLRQIDGAKHEWAIESRKSDTDTPTSDQVAVYLKSSKWPHCPDKGTYRPRRIIRDPACTKSAAGHALTNENQDDDPLAD